VDLLKAQIADDMVIGVPGAMANRLGTAKTPVSPTTWGLIHEVSSVAVADDSVLYVNDPVIPMLPVIGTANRVDCVAAANMVTAAPAMHFFLIFQLVIVIQLSLMLMAVKSTGNASREFGVFGAKGVV
jgi:hypothetical protein